MDDLAIYMGRVAMPVSAYVQSATFFVLAAVALFASAGTIAIATYWVYLGIFAGVFVASLLLLDPDLVRERMRPGGKRPPLALQLVSAILVAHWILAGLDHGRFHWTDTVPTWLQWTALVALAAAFRLCLWAMRVNRFFSSVIRIQSDRGQVVITAGPYAVIRHPGYLAGLIVMVASGIALDSWLAAAMLVVLTVPFLLRRAIIEDRVLKAELPGYQDYADRVRWRLVPGLW
jgi:protein-S-isoprenylcysteine O-methyltransferase Ste14